MGIILGHTVDINNLSVMLNFHNQNSNLEITYISSKGL
jgi:hypothetical protein